MRARATVQVGTVLGIPVCVHVSWLVALFLVSSSLSLQLAASAGRLAPLVALLTTVVLFAALVAHELGHALVARSRGDTVSAITLFVFGGVASLESEPRRARDELAMAIAGPLVSMLVAGVAWAVAQLPLPLVAIEPLLWLARVNVGIAVFNLVPAFPLDGGRILRALLWAFRGDAFRATTTAARVGRGIAYGMIAFGVARALVGWVGDGVWIALVGWFLLSAAGAAIRALPVIPASMALASYVHHVVATGDRRPYVVVDHDLPRGAITIERAYTVPRERWPFMTVGDLACPA
jgi:Zn-dependent protease